jgi:hypothetical protein
MNASKPAGALGPAPVLDVSSPFAEDAVLVLRRK